MNAHLKIVLKFVFTLPGIFALLLFTDCPKKGSDAALSALLELGSSPQLPENGPNPGPAAIPDTTAPDPGPAAIPDTTAPEILAVTPSNNEVDIPIHTGFTIQFSEPVKAATIQINNINSTCSGSVQLSQNGFASCEKLKVPEIYTATTSAFSVVPAQLLESNKTYAVRISTAIKDDAGNSLPAPFQSSFKTVINSAVGATISCNTARLTSLEYLFDPATSQITCTAQPTDPNRIIREIRIKPALLKRNGTGFSDAAYDNQNETIFPYNNDTQFAKEIPITNEKFTPSFNIKQTWVDYGSLRLNTSIHYNDGQLYSTYIDIALHHTAVMSDGPIYMLWVSLEISNFASQAGELPKTQWRGWTSVKYSDGQEIKSPARVVPASGFLLADVNEVARSTTAPVEKIAIYLETTGDDIPDYTWDVPEFAVNPSGTIINLWATGSYTGGKNVIQPVQFF